jgi:hypothetical protein
MILITKDERNKHKKDLLAESIKTEFKRFNQVIKEDKNK